MGREHESIEELLSGAPLNDDQTEEDVRDDVRDLAESVQLKIAARVRVGLECRDPQWVLRLLERIEGVL